MCVCVRMCVCEHAHTGARTGQYCSKQKWHCLDPNIVNHPVYNSDLWQKGRLLDAKWGCHLAEAVFNLLDPLCTPSSLRQSPLGQKCQQQTTHSRGRKESLCQGSSERQKYLSKKTMKEYKCLKKKQEFLNNIFKRNKGVIFLNCLQVLFLSVNWQPAKLCSQRQKVGFLEVHLWALWRKHL